MAAEVPAVARTRAVRVDVARAEHEVPEGRDLAKMGRHLLVVDVVIGARVDHEQGEQRLEPSEGEARVQIGVQNEKGKNGGADERDPVR